jgi:hypothetical protein
VPGADGPAALAPARRGAEVRGGDRPVEGGQAVDLLVGARRAGRHIRHSRVAINRTVGVTVGFPRTATDGPRRRRVPACAAESGVHSRVSPGRPRGFPGSGRPGRRCADDWGNGPGDRDICRAGRAGAAGPSVRRRGYSALGTRAGMPPSCWSRSATVSGTAGRVIPARRSRSRSGRGTGLSGSRSPIGADPGCRSWPVLGGMRKAVAGFSSLRASLRGGDGDGAAG